MRKQTHRMALGGLLTALAVVVMFLGSAVPFATFSVPALASIAILYFSVEYNKRLAALVFAAIALLSLILVPDKEIAFLFAFLLGPYPVLKGLFEALNSAVLSWLLKFAGFNAATIFIYWLMLRVFVVQAVALEFAGYSSAVMAGILVIGNAAFLLYDIALSKLISLYIFRFRPRIQRGR